VVFFYNRMVAMSDEATHANKEAVCFRDPEFCTSRSDIDIQHKAGT
jgi:hypothetical protein